MPKIVDHEQRREEIAKAVLRVVAREGVGGVTVRDVAREAGWSTGVLCHYFDNKRELLIGGLREAARVIVLRMARIMRDRTGLDRLRGVIEEGMPLDEQREALCRIFFFFWAEGVNDPALSAELAAYYDWWRGQIRQAIEYCQADGSVRALDPEALAEMFVAVADGVAVQAMFNTRKISKPHQRDHVGQWLEIVGAEAGADSRVSRAAGRGK
ncbi:MAG: TetR/AcrR family transcriptional regulator [Proteobacteria bacterium]|nr:TetR/AcrR family transcriptional regulator [Pseudomonadota bacterium]